MVRRSLGSARRFTPALALVSLIVFAGAGSTWAAGKLPFTAAGTFVEGCSCNAPCGCELTGVEKGCNGVGAMTLTSGTYNGVSLAGAKIAYATGPGEWVRLYVDAANPRQRDAAKAFARAVYSAFGPIEAVKDAKISIAGKGGTYTMAVDGGKVMQLTTKPVLGGDNRTPIVISNIHDPLHPTVMQGRTVSGTYKDEKRSFTLKDSNSYFAPQMKSKGKI
jgi:hypothetical protein